MGQLNLGLMYRDGDGVSTDYIQAHMWSNLAASKLTGDRRKRAIDCRVYARVNMTTEEVNEAQRLTTEWKPKTWEVIRQELKIGLPE